MTETPEEHMIRIIYVHGVRDSYRQISFTREMRTTPSVFDDRDFLYKSFIENHPFLMVNHCVIYKLTGVVERDQFRITDPSILCIGEFKIPAHHNRFKTAEEYAEYLTTCSAEDLVEEYDFFYKATLH